jgi:hypothetical protein
MKHVVVLVVAHDASGDVKQAGRVNTHTHTQNKRACVPSPPRKGKMRRGG